MRLGLLYVYTQGVQQAKRNGEWNENGEAGAELTQISRIMLHTFLGNL